MKKLICKDCFGEDIRVGDTVELFVGFETKTSWVSKVYWNMLDGAYVESHPAHIKMGIGGGRRLSYFINAEDKLSTYCKKIK